MSETTVQDPDNCDNGRRRIEPDPARRQPLQRHELGPATVRLMLDRSSDSASRNEETQDFLVVECTDSRLCFAVTDGVGSSFVGELAARILARHVTRWLFQVPEMSHERSLSSELSAYLRDLAAEADKVVARFPIPEERSAVVVDVLEQQRAYGSEAMLVCGRIDWPGDGPARVGLAWLGDAHLRVQLHDERVVDLSGRTSDRWSTKHGARGEVRSRIWATSEVRRITGYSDGLIPELDAAVELTDSDLEARLLRLASQSASDDIALVDIALRPGAIPPPTPLRAAGSDHRSSEAEERGDDVKAADKATVTGPVSAAARDEQRAKDNGPAATGSTQGRDHVTNDPAADDQPAAESKNPSERPAEGDRISPANDDTMIVPESLRWHAADRGYAILWDPVPEADAYSVQLADDPIFSNPVEYHVAKTTFALPSMPVPQIWARVRARAKDRAGPWSEGLKLAPRDPPGSSDTHEKSRAADPEPAHSALASLKAPSGLEFRTRRGQLALRWHAVEGASGYVVEIEEMSRSPRPPQRFKVRRPQIELSLRAGRYYVWLRASSPEQPGSWSDPRQVQID